VIALDTNVLVRLFVQPADDEERLQQAIAVQQLKSPKAFFVALTVALELAWVLGKVYECSPQVLKDVFDHLTRMANVEVEGSADLIRAAEFHVKGLDFADALHCLRSVGCAALLTFDDRRFARKARRMGLHPTVVVPELI